MSSKKLFLVLLLIGMFHTCTHAQTYLGLHAGINYPNARISGIDGYIPDPKAIEGFNLGIQVLYPIDEHFSIYSAISYQRNGFSLGVKDTLILDVLPKDIPLGLRFDFFLDYIQVPLLLKYKFNPYQNQSAYVSVGLYGGYHSFAFVRTKIRAIIDFNISSTPLNLNSNLFNRFDMGWMANLGYQIPLKNAILHFEARYHRSMRPWLHNPLIAVDIKHYGFGFLTGISFPINQKSKREPDRA